MRYYIKNKRLSRYLDKSGQFTVRSHLSGDAMSFASEDAAFQHGKDMGMPFVDMDIIWTDTPERVTPPEPVINGKPLSEIVPAKYRA